MSRSKTKIIAITLGDPAGIGPEVTAKALLRTAFPRGIEPLLIGNEDVFRRYWPQSKDLPLFMHLSYARAVKHLSGRATKESGRDSLLYLDAALELIRADKAAALVTAPVSKEAVSAFHPGFKGHTTYLAQAFGLKDVEMVFVADDLKLVLVTRHVALKDVPSLITKKKVLSVLTTTHKFLSDRFGIKAPKVAVLGLNPHAGEAGHMGREEIAQLTPAIAKAQALGMNVHGPFPADTFFESRNCKGYDLIMAMYHDQGLVALKSNYFDRLVNLTVGLPFVRTSPAHGTAFGIAGKNIADAGSMTAALKLAIDLSRRSWA